MSSFLFTINPEKIHNASMRELCEWRDACIATLSHKPNLENKFESDVWKGADDSLMFIYVELARREKELHS